MARITFLLKSEKAPAPIYIRLQDGRKTDVMAKTNLSINPKDWSKKKQQPIRLTSDEFKSLNSKLNTLKHDLLNFYNEHNSQSVINTQWLKLFINPVEDIQGLPADLLGYLKYYSAIRKNKVTESSLKKFQVVTRKVERYQDFKKELILIKDIDKKFQADFEKYCIANNYAPNTIAREIRFIKTVCRHAKENGLCTHYQLEAIKTQYEKVESIYLNSADIEAIKKVELNDSLDNVRDWLIISCYTGQRVSDFMRFTRNMIRQENNRAGLPIMLIEFTQKKTGKIMTLPLHKEIMPILEKRGGDFPAAISDQNYNEYIKTVCKMAGLTEVVKGSKKMEISPKSKIYRKESGSYPKHELVSSHIGRRSFATNFYGTIPTALLIAATGHSTEQMFLNYIGKSSSDRAKELSEYFNYE